jgi:hypothetical protein
VLLELRLELSKWDVAVRLGLRVQLGGTQS